MSVLGFMILLLWLLLFLMLIGSAALSASCGYVIELNRDNSSVLDYFELDQEVRDIADQCIFSDSEG